MKYKQWILQGHCTIVVDASSLKPCVCVMSLVHDNTENDTRFLYTSSVRGDNTYDHNAGTTSSTAAVMRLT